MENPEWKTITVLKCVHPDPLITCIHADDGWEGCITKKDNDQGHMADAYAALRPGMRARILVKGCDIVGVGDIGAKIAQTTLDLMQALGVDVDKACSWAAGPHHWRSASLPHDEYADERVSISRDGMLWLTAKGEGYQIHHDEVILDTELPETMMSAAAGRMLREIVYIPEIDHLDIAIRTAQNLQGRARFTVMDQDAAYFLI